MLMYYNYFGTVDSIRQKYDETQRVRMSNSSGKVRRYETVVSKNQCKTLNQYVIHAYHSICADAPYYGTINHPSPDEKSGTSLQPILQSTTNHKKEMNGTSHINGDRSHKYMTEPLLIPATSNGNVVTSSSHHHILDSDSTQLSRSL